MRNNQYQKPTTNGTTINLKITRTIPILEQGNKVVAHFDIEVTVGREVEAGIGIGKGTEIGIGIWTDFATLDVEIIGMDAEIEIVAEVLIGTDQVKKAIDEKILTEKQAAMGIT